MESRHWNFTTECRGKVVIQNMPQMSFRRPLTLVAGAALAVLVILRSGVLVWMVWNPSADHFQSSLTFWTADTILTASIIVAAIAACGCLVRRVCQRDQERTRVEHLAEVGFLASGLAHEIRNSLNAMHSQLALLRKNLPVELAGEDSPALRRAKQIERALADLEELVVDFLAFARPAQDRLEDVNLAKLVGDVLEFAAMDLEQGRVKVAAQLDASVPSVFADAGKLKRALLNLVINARQAMPDGGTLTVRLFADDRDQIVIEVSDTGCGIPDEDTPRIFQSFFSTKSEGTGLGLAIVRRTIEDCGGRIEFASHVGKGTTFRIHLPITGPRRIVREHETRDQQLQTIP